MNPYAPRLPKHLRRVPMTDAPSRPVYQDAPEPFEPDAPLDFDVMLGAESRTPQFGILGSTVPMPGERRTDGRRVAIDLNGCNTISLFGVQGFGKSYTLGVIAEMAALEVARVNTLPSPLGTVIFHYHPNDTYEPEQAMATKPNEAPSEVDRLLREYNAHPVGLRDIVLLTSEDMVRARQLQYPDIDVQPLKFGTAEIGPEGWRFLMGAAGNRSLYVRRMIDILRRHRGHLSVQQLRDEVKLAGFEPAIQNLAESRLNMAELYIDDSRRLETILRPGRTVIVDLRDEWIGRDEALGLFVVMLRIFGQTTYRGQQFSKLIVFDEAHRYISDSQLIGEVVEAIRQIRHEKNTIVIASQDPLSVPRAAIELTTILVLHRMTSPQWVKHLQGTTQPLKTLDVSLLSRLAPGEAIVWAQRSSDMRFTTQPQFIRVRPRFTQHGGATKTAVR